MAYHSTVTDEPSPRERFFSFLLSLCHSRCVGICFPAISRCYRATLMCLTSCGHKTLSKIGSSKALFPHPFFLSAPEIIKQFMSGGIKCKQHFIPACEFLEQYLCPIHLNAHNSEEIINTVYKNQGEEKRQYG